MRNKVLLAGVAAMAVAALAGAGHARANPLVGNTGSQGVGCEDVRHPVLLNWIERRTICDGPRRADGSWNRVRVLYTPAHTTNASSSCYGTYSVSCTFYPSESYDTAIIERQTYPVSDAPGAVNLPLPDEPGWLPPGTDNVG